MDLKRYGFDIEEIGEYTYAYHYRETIVNHLIKEYHDRGTETCIVVLEKETRKGGNFIRGSPPHSRGATGSKMYILRKIFLLGIMLQGLLSTCGPSAAPLPTVAPIGLPPTWTPPVMATAMPSATELPTFTQVPAFTPMSTPTQDPLSLLSERFQDSLFSPNGRWTA